MKDKDKLILQKMLGYIQEIKDFINGYNYKSFCIDRKTINACVFDLSQIGELAGKISNETQEVYSNIEWRGIKGLRNRIVHDYEGIKLNMVWDFFENDMISLEEDIKNMIDEL